MATVKTVILKQFKEDVNIMSLQVEKLEKNMAKLTIEVSAEELEKAIQNAYHKNKGKMSVPGFRKGKVPRQMLEKMYGKDMFYEEAANELIEEAYGKAYDECELEIVSSPSVDVTQLEAGKPFIFTVEVAIKPEIKLGKYKGVEVEKANIEVLEEEIMKEVEKERVNSSRTITIEDRAVQDGDIAMIDFEGFVDGVAFEGGKGENHSLTIGSGSFIPGFEEQLIGVEIGKDLEVKVTFPEDYQAEDLKGKEAIFKCVVHEIKEKKLPDVDDEFASEVSEFDTLKEYKESIKEKLVAQKETEAKNAKEDAVMEAVIADSSMEIPEAMIQMQQRQLADDFAQRIQSQGLNMEQYFQFSGLTGEKFIEQMKPQAEKRIQSRLVLEAIVEAEKIEANEEEFDAELLKMASMYQMELDKVKEMVGEKEKTQIMKDLAITKAVELIVAKAKEVKAKK